MSWLNDNSWGYSPKQVMHIIFICIDPSILAFQSSNDYDEGKRKEMWLNL